MPEQQGGGLSATTIVLRTRRHWQALDLGFALAREHAGMLYGSWLMLTLPIALLLSLALPRAPLAALFLFWWLKPWYERLPLLYLSKVVFGARLSGRQLASALLRSCRVQLLSTLIWRRLSATRSLDQPIALLEGARGGARRARLKVLHRQAGIHAAVLTSVMALLESALVLAVNVVVVMLVPGDFDAEPLLQQLAGRNFGIWPYFLAIWCVGPLYAACGFSLYINRRCELEGWDIEVGFRRLAARLRGGAALAGCLIVGVLLTGEGRAGESRTTSTTAAVAGKRQDDQSLPVVSPSRSRRLQDADGGAAARESRQVVDRVLAGAKFHRVEAQRLPAFLEDLTGESAARSANPLPAWWRTFLAGLVDVVWWAAWVAVIGISAWLGYRYRYWLAELAVPGWRRPRPGGAAPADMVAGVSLSAAATAQDSPASANALWSAGDERAAMAMLLRLTLVTLVRARGCSFGQGDTEADCARRVAATQDPSSAADFRRLIDAWVSVAYAHRRIGAAVFEELLAGHGRLIAPSSDDLVRAGSAA